MCLAWMQGCLDACCRMRECGGSGSKLGQCYRHAWWGPNALPHLGPRPMPVACPVGPVQRGLMPGVIFMRRPVVRRMQGHTGRELGFCRRRFGHQCCGGSGSWPDGARVSSGAGSTVRRSASGVESMRSLHMRLLVPRMLLSLPLCLLFFCELGPRLPDERGFWRMLSGLCLLLLDRGCCMRLFRQCGLPARQAVPASRTVREVPCSWPAHW